MIPRPFYLRKMASTQKPQPHLTTAKTPSALLISIVMIAPASILALLAILYTIIDRHGLPDIIYMLWDSLSVILANSYFYFFLLNFLVIALVCLSGILDSTSKLPTSEELQENPPHKIHNFSTSIIQERLYLHELYESQSTSSSHFTIIEGSNAYERHESISSFDDECSMGKLNMSGTSNVQEKHQVTETWCQHDLNFDATEPNVLSDLTDEAHLGNTIQKIPTESNVRGNRIYTSAFKEHSVGTGLYLQEPPSREVVMTMRDLHDQNSDFEEENDENEAGNLQKDVQLIHEEENPEVNDASPEVHDASRIAESGENEKQHVFIANDDYVHESNEGGSENDHERDERTAQSPDANTLTKFSEVQGFQNHESETTCERNEGNETNEGPERRMSESIDSDLKEDINKISQQWQLSKEGEMDKDGNRKRDADGNEDGDGDGDADENSEMSREELNERANAFISAFRRKLVISTAVAEG